MGNVVTWQIAKELHRDAGSDDEQAHREDDQAPELATWQTIQNNVNGGTF